MMTYRPLLLAFCLFMTGSYASAFGDGLLRSLGTVSATNSSMACDIQMYNVSAFASELDQMMISRDCSEIRNRTEALLLAMDQANLKLCTPNEISQLKQWRFRLLAVNDKIENHPETYCEA